MSPSSAEYEEQALFDERMSIKRRAAQAEDIERRLSLLLEAAERGLDALPDLPCRIDEMTPREYEISLVASHAVAALQTIREQAIKEARGEG